MKKILTLLFILVAVTATAQTQKNFTPIELNLWPNGPKTSNNDPADLAKVYVFLPDEKRATGRAVVCCPGGGYEHLSMENEGKNWAPFFNGQGIALIVLKYRMPHGVCQVPAEDAVEAMRLVRRNAKAWHINRNDVGIMGFSAGGHLASTVATQAPADAAPNFQILFYPVISMEQGTTHNGSRNQLLGKKPKRKLVAHYSNEQQVKSTTPRAFITLAADDRAVPPTNSLYYYQELHANRVPATMHIYPSGGHGFGIRQSFAYHFEMMLELKAWLNSF